MVAQVIFAFLLAALAPGEHQPCATAPSGMVCIAGGSAVVGNDAGAKNEKPKREIEVSTFYLDTKEVTRDQYEECVKAGACPELKSKANLFDYERALKYCAWAG